MPLFSRGPHPTAEWPFKFGAATFFFDHAVDAFEQQRHSAALITAGIVEHWKDITKGAFQVVRCHGYDGRDDLSTRSSHQLRDLGLDGSQAYSVPGRFRQSLR